jgi:hypothetical protein
MRSHPVRVATSVSISLLFLALLMAAICTGCGEPPPLDMSLLTGEPCEPPCWQGLTPGVSTHSEVNEWMRTSGFVNTRSVSRSTHTRLTRGGDEVAGVTIWWCSRAGLCRGSNRFSTESSVLDDITIRPDYPLTLERLFERYGSPEKYVANVPIGGPLYYQVTLFYPTHGFTAYLRVSIDGTLQPESRVASVWYFRAAPLERFLELRWEQGVVSSTPDEQLEYLRDWPGYGPIPRD